jgi:hypothetical protein
VMLWAPIRQSDPEATNAFVSKRESKLSPGDSVPTGQKASSRAQLPLGQYRALEPGSL